MILWFWLVFVAISSVVGLMLWIFTAIPSVKKEFVTKYLVIMGKIHKGIIHFILVKVAKDNKN